MSTCRLFTTIIGIFSTGFLFAQNVGIGTATPVEKLDQESGSGVWSLE